MNFAWQSLLREEKQGLRKPETALIIVFRHRGTVTHFQRSLKGKCMRFTDDHEHLGLAKRWRSCVFYRLQLLFLVGPATLSLIWLLAVMLEPSFAPAHLSLAYGYLVAVSGVFGALFWIDSPAALRRRLLELLWPARPS